MYAKSKTQISLRIRAVWLVFVVQMKKLCILGFPKCGQWIFLSNCANAQFDQNLLWVHRSADSFCNAVAHIVWTGCALLQGMIIIGLNSSVVDLSMCNFRRITHKLNKAQVLYVKLLKDSPESTNGIKSTKSIIYFHNDSVLSSKCYKVCQKLYIFWDGGRKIDPRDSCSGLRFLQPIEMRKMFIKWGAGIILKKLTFFRPIIQYQLLTSSVSFLIGFHI